MICKKCQVDYPESEYYKGYRTCKTCKKLYQSKYRETHLEKARASVRKCVDIQRFGVPREDIIKSRCEYCGSTKRLSIHHKDGTGRRNNNPNNSSGNLETLCNLCHTRFHQRYAKRYNPDLQQVVKSNWELSDRALGRMLDVAHKTIGHARREIGRRHMNIELVAKICHEVNRAYCRSLEDYSQTPWDDAPDWQRMSARQGVQMHADNPDATPGDSHKAWLELKKKNGWVYGQTKDVEKKEHPCMMEYALLPTAQKAKDYIFKAIVNELGKVGL